MTRPLPAASLLDEGLLPVTDLARIAIREGIRPRDVYQAHKWFARRCAVTARALLVGAACDRSDSFWRTFYQGDAWIGRTVLDPFVGGGVMLLEAHRLGASVRGVDVEPVAVAVARFQTTMRDLPDLTGPLRALADTVGRDLAPFYEAQDEAGQNETLLHAFWVQYVHCDHCGRSYDAHPRFRFAWSDEDHRQWVACSACSTVLEAELHARSVVCPCGAETPTDGGRMHNGEVCCPGCGRREKLIAYARRRSAPPIFRLFGVETLPAGDVRRANVRDRRLRSATAFDKDRYRQAELRLQNLLVKRPHALPAGTIPREGRTDTRLVDYGYSDYTQMFNARQRLHLAMLGAAITKLQGMERDGLAVAFSDHLTTNNMLCAYAGGWRRLTPLFSIRAYRHIARPVEINPWLHKNGRGTFPNAVRAVVRASEALKQPREPSPKGLLKRVKDAPSGSAEIVCADARRMSHIDSASVDFVLTDPPYFDYIPYSELGHFFTPWFRRFRLISRRGSAGFPRGQLASPARSVQAKRRFANKLADAFREIRRVCKPNGRIVFTYQNLDGRGWQAIAQAMARAGVMPVRTFPLYGDSSASLHKHDQSISWDAVMVCRLGEPTGPLQIGCGARESGRQAAEVWSEAIALSDLPFSEGDRKNIGYAASIVAAFSGQVADQSVRRGSNRKQSARAG